MRTFLEIHLKLFFLCENVGGKSDEVLEQCDIWRTNIKAPFDGSRYMYGGTRQRSWLRHYATSRKVAGLIPDEVIGFFS
jgi:hypothetical protein